MLATASGLIGLWLAHHGLALMTAYVTEAQQRSQVIAIDHRAALFALGLALATALLFGIAPAIRIAGLDLRTALAAGGRHRGRGGAGPRHALVAAELALSSLLLVAASLLAGSFQRLATTDPGFEAQGAVAMRLRAVRPAGGGSARPDAAYRSLVEEAARLPGVLATGVVNLPPLLGSDMSSRAAPATRPEKLLRVEFRGASSGYFQALGIPVMGRHELDRLDRDGGEQAVAVLSESAARRLWPGEEAIGHRLLLEWGSGESREVIGVVGDVRDPKAPAALQPTVYLPLRQAPHRSVTLVLRGDSDAGVFAAVRARALRLDPPLVVDEPKVFSQVVAAAVAEPRARALLVTAFALTAVLLAAGGTYSVVSFSVEQRRFDSSVRQALGAHPRLLVRSTIAEMLRHALPGIALGIAASLLVTRTLSGLLYGIDLRDPRVLIGTAALMTLIVAVASYLPAHKLSRNDPAAALRSE